MTPVVIFCGGRGVHIDSSGIRRLKGLVEVAGEPLVVHVMRRYLKYGYSSFILAGGYQVEELRALFERRYAGGIDQQKIQVRVIDTGLETMTGERLARVRPFLGNVSTFAVTYSDSLAHVDLNELRAYHDHHGKLGTLLATRVSTRFRILGLRPGDPQVRGFAAQPVIQNDRINGGFYFFNPGIFQERFGLEKPGAVLENATLETLAGAGELMAYPFEGQWQYLDSERDLASLERLIHNG